MPGATKLTDELERQVSGDFAPLTAVGACTTLVRADVHREGALFTPNWAVGTTWERDGWDGIESEGEGVGEAKRARLAGAGTAPSLTIRGCGGRRGRSALAARGIWREVGGAQGGALPGAVVRVRAAGRGAGSECRITRLRLQLSSLPSSPNLLTQACAMWRAHLGAAAGSQPS